MADHSARVTGSPARTEAKGELSLSPATAKRITVDGLINGMGPFPMMIDTGAERSLISEELALRIGGSPGAYMTLSTLSGRRAFPTMRVAGLTVGPLSFEDFSLVRIPGEVLGAPAVLGIDAIKGSRLTFDFNANVARLEGTLKRKYIPRDAIVIEARARNHWLLIKNAEVAGTRIALIVDSGNEVSIANRPMRRLLARAERPDDPLFVGICGLNGQQIVGEQRTIRRLTFGQIELTSVPIVYLDTPIFGLLGLEDRPALIVGMETLRAFDKVAIDYPANRLEFTLRGQSTASD